jgi:hypothetical protein
MAANDFFYASLPSEQDIACKNTDVTAIAAGDVVKSDATNVVSGTQPTVGVLQGTVAAVNLVGVAMEAIAVGKTGRVRPLGPVVQCVASAAITAGTHVAAAASGKVATQTAGQTQLGLALTAAGANADKVLVMLFGAKNA